MILYLFYQQMTGQLNYGRYVLSLVIVEYINIVISLLLLKSWPIFLWLPLWVLLFHSILFEDLILVTPHSVMSFLTASFRYLFVFLFSLFLETITLKLIIGRVVFDLLYMCPNHFKQHFLISLLLERLISFLYITFLILSFFFITSILSSSIIISAAWFYPFM